MGNLTVVEDLIESKLLELNTAFIGKVLSVSGKKARVQPLNKIKEYGKEEKTQSILTIPILDNVRKFQTETITYVSDVSVSTSKADGYVTGITTDITRRSIEVTKPVSIKKGDLVFCVCADRDSTEARRGKSAVPSVGHHSQSDAMIVGIV